MVRYKTVHKSWSLLLNTTPHSPSHKSPIIPPLTLCVWDFFATPEHLILFLSGGFHTCISLCPSPGWVCWQVMFAAHVYFFRKLPYPLFPATAKLFGLEAPPLRSYRPVSLSITTCNIVSCKISLLISLLRTWTFRRDIWYLRVWLWTSDRWGEI